MISNEKTTNSSELRIEIRKLRIDNTKLWVEIGDLRKEIFKLNSIIDKQNIQNVKKKYIFTIEDEIFGQDGDTQRNR
jgi:hypothetical protein